MWYISGYSTNEPVNLDHVVTMKLEGGYVMQNQGGFFIKFIVPAGQELVWSYKDQLDRDEEYKKILKTVKGD